MLYADKNTKEGAEKYLKYLDNAETPYTHIDGIEYQFDDEDGPNPFKIMRANDGKLLLADHKATNLHYALCHVVVAECPDGALCENVGNWRVFSDATRMKYEDAKAKCSSWGASLVGKDAVDAVRYGFPMSLPYHILNSNCR